LLLSVFGVLLAVAPLVGGPEIFPKKRVFRKPLDGLNVVKFETVPGAAGPVIDLGKLMIFAAQDT
jgi:hypothetical protein